MPAKADKSAGHSSTLNSTCESLKILRPRGFESLELRVGSAVRHSYPRHWHDELFVTAITEGTSRFQRRGVQQVAGPGTLVVVVPGEVHAHYDGSGGRSFRSLHLPMPVLREIDEDLLLNADAFLRKPSCLVQDPTLFRSFLKLHHQMAIGNSSLRKETFLLAFFRKLARKLIHNTPDSPAKPERAAVRRAQRYLSDYSDRPVALKDLASAAGLSPFHFHRAFCREVGIPPHEYQVQLRILHAKQLLRSGHAIATAAAAAGFADQSHLTRQFKRALGVTPAQYAGMSKNVQDLLHTNS